MHRLRRRPCLPFPALLVALCALSWCICSTSALHADPPAAEHDQHADEQELLRLHEAVLAAHRNNDLDSWMQDEADHYVMVNRGEVLHPDKEVRRAQLQPYLNSTTFTKYADVIPPQVRVSRDATLGWVIAQVQIVGTRQMSDGTSLEFDDTWAWIELYEKQDGRWLRIGNVSNHKPE